MLGNRPRLIVFPAPPVVRFVTISRALEGLSDDKRNVASLMEKLLIPGPATLVRISVPLARLIVLFVPPMAWMVLARTVPPLMFSVPTVRGPPVPPAAV